VRRSAFIVLETMTEAVIYDRRSAFIETVNLIICVFFAVAIVVSTSTLSPQHLSERRRVVPPVDAVVYVVVCAASQLLIAGVVRVVCADCNDHW
jgi:hypothetical protein